MILNVLTVKSVKNPILPSTTNRETSIPCVVVSFWALMSTSWRRRRRARREMATSQTGHETCPRAFLPLPSFTPLFLQQISASVFFFFFLPSPQHTHTLLLMCWSSGEMFAWWPHSAGRDSFFFRSWAVGPCHVAVARAEWPLSWPAGSKESLEQLLLANANACVWMCVCVYFAKGHWSRVRWTLNEGKVIF